MTSARPAASGNLMSHPYPKRSNCPPGRGSSILVTAVGLLLLVAACDDGIPGSGPGSTIERERFIEVMVELRYEAVRSPTGRITDTARDGILGRQGLVEDDLRSFVEVHGRNVPLMTEVWAEVQLRLADTLGVEVDELEVLEEPDELPEVLP